MDYLVKGMNIIQSFKNMELQLYKIMKDQIQL